MSKEPDIVVIKPDKGNGVVILNIYDYKNKVKNTLNDNSKVKMVKENVIKLTPKLENKLNKLIKNN